MTLDDDLDQDGYLQSVDCNDNNAAINQGQTEIAYNGLDDDCNPATFDDDIDRDGFIQAEDCNDNDENVNPNVEEIPENEIDDDCNGIVDDIVVNSDLEDVEGEYTQFGGLVNMMDLTSYNYIQELKPLSL